MKQYGLIGKVLVHSFSKKFFTEKFEREGIDAQYDLFELPTIEEFKKLVEEKELYGLNVTIPYKELVIPFLDELDPTAEGIGAVNTIKFIRDSKGCRLKGYNTDIIGFRDSIKPLLRDAHEKALVLGTGGASKAVCYALEQMGLEYKYVSRTARPDAFTYAELNEEIMSEYLVVVNTSPLGMFPNVDSAPDIPYEYLSEDHLLYDLVYNPENTKFCQLGKAQGAVTKSGLDMLHGQAVAAWKIWNE